MPLAARRWLVILSPAQRQPRTIFRLALARFYQSVQRLPQAERDHTYAGPLHRLALPNARWDQWYLASVTASGLVWGAAGFWLFPQQATIHQLALSFVMGDTVAGGETSQAFFLSSLLEKQNVAYVSTLGYPDSPEASFGQDS